MIPLRFLWAAWLAIRGVNAVDKAAEKHPDGYPGVVADIGRETKAMIKENLIEPIREVYSREREGRCPECGGPHSQAWHRELVKIHRQRQAWKALIFILILAGSFVLYCWWTTPTAYHSILEGR